MHATFESFGILPRTYTTTEAAQLCHLSPQRVIQSFETGRLKGFIVPESDHRRIPAPNLQQFAIDHGIDVDIPIDRFFLLFAQYSESLVRSIQKLMDDTLDASKIHLATSAFDAGMVFADVPLIKHLYVESTGDKMPKGMKESFTGRVKEYETAVEALDYMREHELLTVQNLFDPGSHIPASFLRHPPVSQIQSSQPDLKVG